MAEHERDVRPWGYYEVLESHERHKVKRIAVSVGHRLSYQRHQRRSEHWFVVEGSAVVEIDDVLHALESGDAIDVPVGAAHRVANVGDGPLIFIEIQTGDYFGEDDITRLNDDYGRRSVPL